MTVVETLWDVYANKTEKDLRPYNATRYSLYGNLRSGNYRGGVAPLLTWEYVHGNQEGWMNKIFFWIFFILGGMSILSIIMLINLS